MFKVDVQRLLKVVQIGVKLTEAGDAALYLLVQRVPKELRTRVCHTESDVRNLVVQMVRYGSLISVKLMEEVRDVLIV